MKTKLEYDDHGLLFIPHFIQQESDLNYGEVVTHENYNEKLNLNRLQGDYNTEVLRILFTEQDPTKIPHVPYLDKRVDVMWDDFNERITDNTASIETLDNVTSAHGTAIERIIAGAQTVGLSEWAEGIVGVDEAGPNKYYGTGVNGGYGFHSLPDALYAIDSSENEVEVTGVYFTPQADSIDKTMLTPALREQIEQSAVTSYPELTGKPSINGVVLEGELSLEQLNVQQAGPYLTSIPDIYVTSEELEGELNTVNDAIEEMDSLHNGAITALGAQITNLETNVANTYSVVCINTFQGTPKVGDILITV